MLMCSGFRNAKASQRSGSVMISPDGGSTLQTVVSVTSQCFADIYLYPYYSYTCSVEFMFPGYSTRDVNVTLSPSFNNVRSTELR